MVLHIGKIQMTVRRRGFSLIEVIISLFVLSVGFVGIMSLATSTLRSSFLQRDAVTASLLVQEGSELVYNIRDTSLAKGEQAFTDIPAINAEYRVDPFGSEVSLESNAEYSLRRENGRYVHGGSGTLTKFSRKIIIEDSSSGSDLSRRITSIVVWGRGDFPQSDEAHCNVSSRCMFARTNLQEDN